MSNPLTRIDTILSKLLTGYISMNRPTGGRGKKALYSTTHMRVPEPIKAEVKGLIDRFHDEYIEGEVTLMPSLPDAIATAKGILLQKKSAKVSLEKLLTALYHTETKLN